MSEQLWKDISEVLQGQNYVVRASYFLQMIGVLVQELIYALNVGKEHLLQAGGQLSVWIALLDLLATSLPAAATLTLLVTVKTAHGAAQTVTATPSQTAEVI